LIARLRLAALALTLLTTRGALAAPPDDRVLAIDQYTSEKARALGQKYATALGDLNAGIYHCLPWLHVPKESIGFFRPKHLGKPRDDRYLSLRVYITQDGSPQFAALKLEERAAAMFSRYVGAMLRRMTERQELVADPLLDGFTVIVDWLKPTSQLEERPVRETIAVFADRPTVADYVAGRASIRDLAARASVFGFDGETPVGQLKIQAWEDNFVKTFRIANDRPEPGVTCR
jgi:hypothetical protein